MSFCVATLALHCKRPSLKIFECWAATYYKARCTGSVIESVIAERLKTNHAKLPMIVKKFFDKYGLGMYEVQPNNCGPGH